MTTLETPPKTSMTPPETELLDTLTCVLEDCLACQGLNWETEFEIDHALRRIAQWKETVGAIA